MYGFLIGLGAAILILVGLWLLCPQGWKTRIYGALVAIVGLLEALRQMLATADLSWLSPEIAGGAVLGVGVAIVVLRQVTSTPPGKKA